MLGFIGMIIGVVQAQYLPAIWGLEHPATWIVAVLVAILVGAALGGLQGSIIAYLGVPSFIVTLGGLLIWRGAAWWVTQGQTLAPMDSRFQAYRWRHRGRDRRQPVMDHRHLAAAVILALRLSPANGAKLSAFISALYGASCWSQACFAPNVLGAVLIANSYPLPMGVARRIIEAAGGTWPQGGVFIAHGLAIPVLIAALRSVSS
jgi:D-xylose transport system permease protein